MRMWPSNSHDGGENMVESAWGRRAWSWLQLLATTIVAALPSSMHTDHTAEVSRDMRCSGPAGATESNEVDPTTLLHQSESEPSEPTGSSCRKRHLRNMIAAGLDTWPEDREFRWLQLDGLWAHVHQKRIRPTHELQQWYQRGLDHRLFMH